MDLAEKLEILADSAKYDVACTLQRGGSPRTARRTGQQCAAGICHAFTRRAVRSS